MSQEDAKDLSLLSEVKRMPQEDATDLSLLSEVKRMPQDIHSTFKPL